MIHIVCLYDRRRKGEQLRVGAIRYPPRGKRKEDVDEYDVRLPELAPSRDLLRKFRMGAISWERFVQLYRSEMNKPERKYLIPLFAALSKVTTLAIGCTCPEESQCHRSVLRELLTDAGAELA
ncbi:MAG: DUF488 family protein [Acidobacteria bacterium]|nr:DUF488 family protein [Acidobacteriota bacterium]